MNIKNLLWLAVFASITSCTISKRIDKWGYHIAFQKHNDGISESTEAINAPNESTLLVAATNNENSVSVTTPSEIIQEETLTPEIINGPLNNKPSTFNSINNTHKTSFQKQRADKVIAKQHASFQSNSNIGFRPSTLLLLLLAIFIPPLAVFLYEGSWTNRCTINLLLCLFFVFPGIIHALIVVLL